VYQEVIRKGQYTIFYDDVNYNYKIHDGHHIISYPSTLEVAMLRIGYINRELATHCTGCTSSSCNDCERY
jgi:hypothetical protein